MSINKLKNEIDQLRRDLDNKLAASRKVKASISHSIEQQLLEENSDNYYEGSVKNWTLLRKHVYALQSYSKKYMNGKIPPRHQLAGLDKRRFFPKKNLLFSFINKRRFFSNKRRFFSNKRRFSEFENYDDIMTQHDVIHLYK